MMNKYIYKNGVKFVIRISEKTWAPVLVIRIVEGDSYEEFRYPIPPTKIDDLKASGDTGFFDKIVEKHIKILRKKKLQKLSNL